MGFSIGSIEFESLTLGDAPLEALMLGDVELWSAGGSGPVALVPMSWGSSTSFAPGFNAQAELVNYTVVGSGVADLPATLEAEGTSAGGLSFRRMFLYVNGIEVGMKEFSSNTRTLHNHTFENVTLNDGDLLSYKVFVGANFSRRIYSWSFSLIPN